MIRRLVIGDIHGRFEALKEVLKKVKFNYNKDKLICLGDVVDGGPRTCEVIEELLKIKNLIYLIGNHDEWFMNHIKSGWADEIWLRQGGRNTIASYKDKNVPVTHQDFFDRGKYYHIEDNMLFVHGGFRPEVGVKKETKFNLIWDRDLIEYAKEGNYIKPYDWVFVGHSTTQNHGLEQPIKYMNLFMMDCGAGWNGKLCIMNIDTKKYELSKQQPPAQREAVGKKARELTMSLFGDR